MRNIISISGSHVFAESGVHVIGDFTTTVESGLHVMISGQHVYVESGVHVTTQPEIGVSGIVQVQSGIVDVREYGYHVLSGEWRPKAVCDSGEMVVCSGLHVVADIAESGIGVQIQSGAHVQISGQHVYVESGVHVVVESGIGVTATVSVDSGLGVLISGQHVYVESGVHVTTQPGIQVSGMVDIETPTNIIINATVNPLIVTTGSGGTPLTSGEIISVIVKACTSNVGIMYVGGYTAGQMPFNGGGLQMFAGEAVNIDIDQLGKVHCCASLSGDCVTYLANT